MNGGGNGPFPGLAPFEADDTDWFFGRSRECRLVVDNVLARPITVLLGPSGAGKSSLLRAAVVPTLRAMSAPPVRVVICASWGEGPSAALRRALADAPEPVTAPDRPLEELLAVAAERSRGRLVLVLDQFEEQFASGDPLDEAFACAVASAGPAVTVLIAIREDALGALERYEQLLPGLFDNLIPLDHLDPATARGAIEQAVAAWSKTTGHTVRVEPALVDAVIEQVADGTGEHRRVQMPHLQLVMARLWQEDVFRGGGDALRADTLARLGGAKRIAAAYVEEAMAGCTPREQDLAAAMLDRLLTPTGAKVPLASADLARYTDAPVPEVRGVLERLTRARLLAPTDDRYQLSHDALAAPLLRWRAAHEARRARRRERRRLLAIMAFVAALLGFLQLVGALDAPELATVDERFALRGAQPAPQDLVLVKIDDASLAKLKTPWPPPRKDEARAIDWIGNGHPRVIAYDVDFSDRHPGDQSLMDAINGSPRRVVLAAQAVNPDGSVNLFGYDNVPQVLPLRAGYAGMPNDGGVIRRLYYAYDGVPSFAVAAAEVARGRAIQRSEVDGRWIDYLGPEGTIRSVPFWEVARHRIPPAFFRDKIVVVGHTSPAYQRFPVWGVDHADMSGAEIEANAIDTLWRGAPLRSVPWELDLLLIAVFAVLPLLVEARAGVLAALLVALGVAALYAFAAYVAFDHGLVLQVVAPLAALLLAVFAVVLVAAVVADWKRGPSASGS